MTRNRLCGPDPSEEGLECRQESSMVGTSKQGTVALKMVSPIVPKGVDQKAMLEEDLTQMGCHGLMDRPWCIKYEKIVQELQRK